MWGRCCSRKPKRWANGKSLMERDTTRNCLYAGQMRLLMCCRSDHIYRVVEYSSLAERNFYRNTKTGETYWSMPPQVKFYIPPKLEDKVRAASTVVCASCVADPSSVAIIVGSMAAAAAPLFHAVYSSLFVIVFLMCLHGAAADGVRLW